MSARSMPTNGSHSRACQLCLPVRGNIPTVPMPVRQADDHRSSWASRERRRPNDSGGVLVIPSTGVSTGSLV